MQEYIVNHNGSTTDKDGKLYTYKAGNPIMLPDEAAKALGEDAKPTGRSIMKDAKNVLNKMVGNEETKTK